MEQTSLWEELGVDVFKRVLIDDSARALLQTRKLHRSVPVTVQHLDTVCKVGCDPAVNQHLDVFETTPPRINYFSTSPTSLEIQDTLGSLPCLLPFFRSDMSLLALFESLIQIENSQQTAAFAWIWRIDAFIQYRHCILLPHRVLTPSNRHYKGSFSAQLPPCGTVSANPR